MTKSSFLDVDRRDFLKASGLTMASSLLPAAAGGRSLIQEARAQESAPTGETEQVKTVCPFCAVGCGAEIKVKNDAVVGLETWDDNPINEGKLCSKGSAITEHVNSEKRLKEPMKKENGSWKNLTWDQAASEIASKLNDIRDQYGPDSTMWIGSAKIGNEEAYMFRKMAAFYGTNNVDHQARICHSTTVAGLANTWGFGAQTNTLNDYVNQDAVLVIGHNPAETHPVLWRRIFEARRNGCDVIVAEPRSTKTAALGDQYVRFRPGTDIPFIYGLLHHIIFDLGAADEKFLADRVYGWESVKERVKEYDLETVSDITWVSVDEIKRAARTLADSEVSSVDWCMGATQHSVGTQNIRSFALLNLTLGHSAQPGGGANVVRGHDNVQGATDLCILSHSLPGYYGLSKGAWEHWARVWDRTQSTSGSTSYDDMLGRFESEEFMEKPGLTVARWFEGGLSDDERETELYQPNPLKAVVFWGHSVNCISEMAKMKRAMENLDLVVGVDPFPALTGTLPERDDGVYLLPAATQLESKGSVTNTHRSIQWRSRAVTPRHNSKTDYEIMQRLADELGFGEHFDYGDVEDVTREWNLGMRTIGMIGQTPERLKAHQENAHVFSTKDLNAEVTSGHSLAGDYYGLPWPCWHDEHPGTPILYNDGMHPAKGGLDFRARWGTTAPDIEAESAPDEKDLLRAPYNPGWWGGTLRGVPQYPLWHKVLPDPSSPAAKTVPIGYAEREDRSVYDAAVELANRGYDVDPADYEGYDYKQPDPPTGRGRARAYAWNLTDPVPVHREPVETPRPDLIDEYPNFEKKTDFYRLDLDNRGAQKARKDLSKEYPLILTTGRQLEHQGGGAGTRNNKFLIDRAPMMYAEINPRVANEMGVKTGKWVRVKTQRGDMVVQARVTERVNEEEVFLPFHWGGIFQGENYSDRYPEDLEPLGVGDSANIGTSDGYDVETSMQETKVALCAVEPAKAVGLPRLQKRLQEERGYLRAPLRR